ncbi:MAG TPA: SLC13 family permease [Opitutaceae bacterium]|nr:SLC13 family permease [Opitutaceae bacterium]
MTPSMWIVIAVIGGAFAVMATGRVRSELAALAACCALVLSGVLSTTDLFPALGSDAVVTVGAMFVLSAALDRTGVIDSASRFLQRLPLRSEFALLCLLLPLVFALSAFVNNTPVVVVFLPILVALAHRNHLTVSKLLIPLSFASILGGTTTLIGTSTNLVASTAGLHAGLPAIGMFELTKAGCLLGGFGLVYLLLLGPRFLPSRGTASLFTPGGARHFVTEAFVPAGSALVGRTAAEALAHVQARGRVVEIARSGGVLAGNPAAVVLEAGDRLRIDVDAASVTTLKHRRSLRLQTAGSPDLALGDTEEMQLVECVVGPRSSWIGHPVGEAGLARPEDMIVLALHRSGMSVPGRFDTVPLESGDVLLVEATDAALESIRQGDDLLVLAGGQRLPRRRKRWIAIVLIVAVVSLSAWQFVPVTIAAVAAAIIAVLSGCIDAEEAYHALDWPTLFLIAGTLALGTALEQTHTAGYVAKILVGHTAQFGPWLSLCLVVFVASVLTNFLSNNAVAALLVPMALEAAHVLHASPRPFLMAVTFGASACFATPIGYQTNTLVFTAGGYRFGDFVRFGLPLNIFYLLAASAIIPAFWPFH